MDPEDILKEYSKRFCRELEAKPLLMEIRNIFMESTAQEIERVIDREGNIFAMDRILLTLPMRTNWVTVFYNALNGKEINKPELAKLFKPFINTDSSSEDEEIEDEETEEEETANKETAKKETAKKGKKATYSLGTSLKDVAYFQVLKDLYPDDPPNWAYFIHKNGLQPSAKLCDVLDNLFVKNKPAYDQIKQEVNISHAYIRQATLDIDITSLPSIDESASTDMTHKFSVPISESKSPVTSSKESSTKKLTLSSGSLNTEQPHLPPLCEVVCLQEKAWKNMTQNPAQENETVSVSTNYIRPILGIVDKDLTVSLPNLPRPDCKSEHLNIKNLNSEYPEDEFSKQNMPENNINNGFILEADVINREVPEAVGSNIEVLKTVDNKEEVPKADVSKSEVLERNACKSKVPEANFIKRECRVEGPIQRECPVEGPIQRECPVEGPIQREVPESQEDNERLMLDVNDIEISETSLSLSTKQFLVTLNTKRKVPEADVSNRENLETDSSNSEVPESYVSEREVLEAVDNKMEAPQGDIREREIPEANGIKQEVPETVNKKMELLEVNEAREPDNDSTNIRASSSTKADQVTSSMGLHMSVLLLAIVLSFSFGYYCRR